MTYQRTIDFAVCRCHRRRVKFIVGFFMIVVHIPPVESGLESGQPMNLTSRRRCEKTCSVLYSWSKPSCQTGEKVASRTTRYFVPKREFMFVTASYSRKLHIPLHCVLAELTGRRTATAPGNTYLSGASNGWLV